MATTKARIDPRILILFMVIGLIPLGVGSLLLLTGARDAHVEVAAEQLSQAADNAQTALSDYLQRTILQVAALGTVPDIRDAALRSNGQKMTPAQEQMEKDWTSLDPNRSQFLASMLGNNASRFLRDYLQLSPSMKEIMVTDIMGRVVAANQKTTDYLQSDERWWAYAYRQGAGGAFLSDIYFDESAGLHAIEIAQPIIDQTNQAAIGVVKAVLDAQEIFGFVNAVEIGEEGNTALIRGDGIVVVSRRTTAQQQEKYPYFEEIRAAIGNQQRHIEAGEGNDRIVIGLPQTRLKSIFPELDWYLVAQKSRRALYGYFLNITWSYLYIVLFSVAVVGALSLLFSWILQRPVIETDPHLEQL